MTDATKQPDETGAKKGPAPELKPGGRTAGRMHDNVPDWSDPVCTCEAEPYWIAVSEEFEEEQKKDALKEKP